MSSVKDSILLNSGASDTFTGTTANLIRHFSSKNATSTANFSSGSNSSVNWVDLTGNSNMSMTNVSFDTSTKLITCASNSVLNAGNLFGGTTSATFTIEMWFKKTGNSGGYVNAVGSNVQASIGGFAAYIEQPGANNDFDLAKYYVPSGLSDQRFPTNPGIEIATNVFNQLVFGANGATVFLFINGGNPSTGAYSNSVATNTVNTGGANVFFGSFSGGTSSLLGDLGIIRIYDDVLTLSEVQANYNANKAEFGLS
tara:strand:- start:132 stop:896 length:765 start_codon:yes stop_codon:yes gene_type:complete